MIADSQTGTLLKFQVDIEFKQIIRSNVQFAQAYLVARTLQPT